MNTKNISNEPISFMEKIDLKRIMVYLFIILIFFGAGGSYYFYKKYSALKANPNLEAQKQTDKFISAVGKLMELPKNETPTVATIVDKNKLNTQSFFSLAENGDILLAYTTSMKAILYRPSVKKIINVAPIYSNQPAVQTAPPAVAAVPIRVAYYNGSGIVGLSGVMEKEVKTKYPNYQTAVLANATTKDYQGNLVVDLSGKNSEEAAELAGILKGKVASLPKGEVIPDADILIIAGK